MMVYDHRSSSCREEGHADGQANLGRWIVGSDRAVDSAAPAAAVSSSRAKARRFTRVADGNSVRVAHGHPVGDAAAGDGVRQRNDVLAAPSRLARGRRVGAHPSPAAGEAP